MSPDAPESALIVPVHDAEEAVGRLRHKLDPSSGYGLPAHVTVLYPFGPVPGITDEQVDALAAAFASCPAFDFTLSAVGWFDARVLYLAPEDPAPFVALTEMVAAMFPAFPPYGGAYDSIVPHVTVGEGAPRWRMRWAARTVAKGLPIECTADAVWWMAPTAGGRWGVTTRFDLGLQPGRTTLPSI